MAETTLEARIAQVIAPILVGYERQITELRAQLANVRTVPSLLGVSIKQADDPRKFLLVQNMSDGSHIETPVNVPVPLYRGIWAAGNFEAGDMVTHKGAAWIANGDTAAEPGTNDEWRCFVQRGKPGPRGRDAVPQRA